MIASIDMDALERLLVGGALALLALLVAFGPEARRQLWRMRTRERAPGPLTTPGAAAGRSRIQIGGVS